METPYWEQVGDGDEDEMEKEIEPANSGTEPVCLSWRQVPSSPAQQSHGVRVNNEHVGLAITRNEIDDVVEIEVELREEKEKEVAVKLICCSSTKENEKAWQ